MHAICELPPNLLHLYSDKLVYIKWFNGFPPKPVDLLQQFTTYLSLTLEGRQRSAIVPLSDVNLLCHLTPKFNSLKDDDGDELILKLDTDIFKICCHFYLNDFSSYCFYELMGHWMPRKVKS
jgi:hypothetical protein